MYRFTYITILEHMLVLPFLAARTVFRLIGFDVLRRCFAPTGFTISTRTDLRNCLFLRFVFLRPVDFTTDPFLPSLQINQFTALSVFAIFAIRI